MRKIYTGIDLGSYSIKIVVCEVMNHKFHVLASSNIRCKGIKNGIVIDTEQAKIYLKEAKKEIEQNLNIELNQAIVTVPSQNCTFEMVEGKIKVEKEDKLIGSDEVNNVFQEAVIGKVKDQQELITITPISFQVDGKESILDPKGMVGDTLSVKAVMASIPKENFKATIGLLRECGIEVVDVTLGAIGDYYAIKNSTFDSTVSAMINIGYSKTEVSIFNKGILIKNSLLESGSRLVDKDLAYIYQIKKGQARKLKENFAISNTRYSDVNDTMEFLNKNEETIIVNQLEVSEIVEARLNALLKLAKKQIPLLTNREISTIIITGGITELAGFEYDVENVFDRRTTVLDMNTMGIRNNMYSSCYGILKYFHHKLDLRGLSYSMIEENNNNLSSTKEKESIGLHDRIIGKVFGYFSNDRED